MIICTATAAKLVKVKMLNDIAEQDMNTSTEQKGKYFMSSKVNIIENKTEHASIKSYKPMLFKIQR